MQLRSAFIAFLVVGLSCPMYVHASTSEPATDPGDVEALVEDYDPTAALQAYNAAELALFDHLRSDPSPRQQILIARIHLDEEEQTPSALRPKTAEVVARAVQMAPDDALVQWLGAMDGRYTSSSCGPTTWPEAEVANLLRLEPENAAAWQFAVALASAKGDQAGVDDALSRMAMARRADDHFGAHLAEWRKAYGTQPQTGPMAARRWEHASPSANALLSALQRVSYSYSPAKSVLESACTTDAGESTWRRMGWCADAARKLAENGGSLALRAQGLELLAAIGDRSDTTMALQQQYDWLDAHDANPLRNFDGDESADTALADWHDAKTEIEVIERKLRRMGQPFQAPQGWSKQIVADGAVDAGMEESQAAFQLYTTSLVEQLRVSSNARERAVAIASASFMAMFETSTASATPLASGPADSLRDLAAAHPDNLLVQWLAAHAAAPGESAPAIAIVQKLDADNAAAWVPALSRASADTDETSRILERMASGRRYDDHVIDVLDVLLDAMKRHPMSPQLTESLPTMGMGTPVTPEIAGIGVASAMAYSTTMDVVSVIVRACAISDDVAAAADQQNCIAIGRLMLHSGTSLITAKVGEGMLRKLDAMDAGDLMRARQIAWWRATGSPAVAIGGDGITEYYSDLRATGSEIEAMRLAAQRAGKAEPAAAWQSPAEKRSAARTKPAG